MNTNHFSAERSLSHDEIGVIILNEDGSISQSSGELENDNKTAKIISSIIDCIQLYESINPGDGHFNNITIQFDDCSYSVQISRKSTVTKRRLNSTNAIDT